jgi:hypothetical protein
MTVPETQDPGIVVVLLPALDLHQAEVARTIVGEAVRLGADGQVGRREGALDGLDELVVRTSSPCNPVEEEFISTGVRDFRP